MPTGAHVPLARFFLLLPEWSIPPHAKFCGLRLAFIHAVSDCSAFLAVGAARCGESLFAQKPICMHKWQCCPTLTNGDVAAYYSPERLLVGTRRRYHSVQRQCDEARSEAEHPFVCCLLFVNHLPHICSCARVFGLVFLSSMAHLSLSRSHDGGGDSISVSCLQR